MRNDNMSKKKIKLVAFDLGYTLVYNAREENYANYLAEKNIDISAKEIEQAFHYADKTFMRHYIGALGRPPQIVLPWYLGVINYRLKQQFDLIEQTQFFIDQTDMSSYWKCFPWTKDVLQGLKEKGYKLALLSNWDLSCRSLLKRLAIFDEFDYVLVSSEVDIEKPDQRIFEMLLEETGYEPDEILYVGDNYYDDVVGSRKVGIETILINRFGKIGIEEINDCQVVESTKELLTLLDDVHSNATVIN